VIDLPFVGHDPERGRDPSPGFSSADVDSLSRLTELAGRRDRCHSTIVSLDVVTEPFVRFDPELGGIKWLTVSDREHQVVERIQCHTRDNVYISYFTDSTCLPHSSRGSMRYDLVVQMDYCETTSL